MAKRSGKKRGRTPEMAQKTADYIAQEYVEGQKPFTKLPTIQKLTKQYEVSRNTILAALDILVAKEKVERRIGSGLFVGTYAQGRWFPQAGKMIGVSAEQIGHHLEDSSTSALISGLLKYLERTEINVLLKARSWNYTQGIQPRDHFTSPEVLGLLLIGPHKRSVIDSLRSLNKPIISIDHDATAEGLSSVCMDNRAAGAFLAKRLFKLGHRRIAAVVEAPDKPSSKRDQSWDERANGFMNEWNKMGAPTIQSITMESRTLLRKEEVDRILSQPRSKRPTAIYSPNAGVLTEIRTLAEARKLTIPKDLSLVFGGRFLEQTDSTGIQFDSQALTSQAAKRLLEYISGTRPLEGKPALIRIKGKYVAGDSHGPAP